VRENLGGALSRQRWQASTPQQRQVTRWRSESPQLDRERPHGSTAPPQPRSALSSPGQGQPARARPVSIARDPGGEDDASDTSATTSAPAADSQHWRPVLQFPAPVRVLPLWIVVTGAAVRRPGWAWRASSCDRRNRPGFSMNPFPPLLTAQPARNQGACRKCTNASLTAKPLKPDVRSR